MRIIVDHLPTSPRECPFTSNSTGKYRCKFDAHLCPIVRDGGCPYLADTSDSNRADVKPIIDVEDRPDPNRVVDKSPTRSRKKTNKV